MGAQFLVGKKLMKVSMPVKTNIVQSVLHGQWGPSHESPAMLCRVGNIDPWVNARAKYSKANALIDQKIMAEVVASISQEMKFTSLAKQPWEPRVFTLEEAVKGIAGVDFWDGIPRNTSPGYPFCVDNKSKGKTKWFGSEGEFDFSGADAKNFAALVSSNIEMMKKNIRPVNYYVDYLKDERRPFLKVQAGKTRLISASAMDLFVESRMYFGDMVRSTMSNHTNNSIAVGCNPFSNDWDFIAKHLLSKGNNMIFGDYSGFDASLCSTLMYWAFDVIENFYYNASDEERLIRRVLFEDVVNSKHVYTSGGVSVAYEWSGSNPSGNFLTTILNCVCNLIAIKYSSVVAHKQFLSDSLLVKDLSEIVQYVSDHVGMIVYGDDNGISFSDEAILSIPLPFFLNAMTTLNLTYTTVHKDNTVHAYQNIEQCSFLKRRFAYDSSLCRYVCPLELSVVLEMPYWSKRNNTEFMLIQTLDTAVLELSLHEEDVYNMYISKFDKAANELLNFQIKTSYKQNRRICLCRDEY